MDEKTKEMIKERFNSLPKMIQEVILSSHYEETLLEIGKQYNLNVEQLGMLEQETTLVMMGLTPTKDFETELTRELGIDKLKGSQIVKDINEKIFLKIRELLKLMNTPIGEEPSLEGTTDVPKNVIITTDTEKEKIDTQILHSAGIEIIPEKLELSTPSSKLATPQEGNIHPILAQKLSGFVKNDVVETEHSLNNLTQSGAQNARQTKPTIDPYREIPE